MTARSHWHTASHWAQSRALALLCVGLLALLLAWLLVRLFWQLVLPPTLPEPSAQPMAPAASTVLPAQAVRIADYQLFGQASGSDELSRYINAPETPLDLELRGIVAGADPAEGFAIIRDTSGRQRAFRPGDEVAQAARVRGIYPDRVVMQRNGRFETLRLPIDQQQDPASWQLAESAPATDTGAAPGPRPLSAAMPQVRDLLTINLAQAAASYGLVPVPGGGYRISLGRNASQLVESGLANGDIILSANGAALDDPAAVQQMLQDLLAGQAPRLEIRRGGEIIHLTPDLEAVMGAQNP